jgi:hypothetical protein
MGFAFTTMLIMLLLLALPIVAGVVLIISNRRRTTSFPQCGKCGYNVSASIGTTTRCPECGGEFAEVGITPTVAQGRPAAQWLGIAMVTLPLMCVGAGVVYSFAAQSAARARASQAAAQAAAAARAAQAARAAAATLPAAPSPANADADAESGATIPPPLTQQQIDAMNGDQLRRALAEVARARRVTGNDQELDQRLQREFSMILQRLRDVPDGP